MRAFFADRKYVTKDFREKRLPKGDYENCVFQNCQFQEGLLDNQNFVECQFVNCDLTNTNVAHTQFNDVRFEGCKLVGVHFETCDPLLLGLGFKGCNLTLASFYEMDISGTHFLDCRMHKMDFTESVLSKCNFAECDLKDAVFEGTHLERASFISAFNYTIDPNKNRVKKARFSQEGLIGLLKKYDIVVN